jgi:Xaa-Pro aminopeptidase
VRHTRSRVRFEPAGDLIEELREVKDEEEIAQIRGAGRITVEVFREVVRQACPGVSERDLAAEIDYRMRKKGAEAAAFETIVASGGRGALPHARASAKLLEKDELVILDLGAILNAYAADMTRTIALGEPTRRVRSLYNAVLGAQRNAVEALGDGVRAKDVDGAARRFLARRGVARYFLHSTGHGVGLEVHERPRLARGERARLKAGCVLTVEPGVYLDGLGGIRIEDTFLLGRDGPEILTPASKDHWVIA